MGLLYKLIYVNDLRQCFVSSQYMLIIIIVQNEYPGRSKILPDFSSSTFGVLDRTLGHYYSNMSIDIQIYHYAYIYPVTSVVLPFTQAMFFLISALVLIIFHVPVMSLSNC